MTKRKTSADSLLSLDVKHDLMKRKLALLPALLLFFTLPCGKTGAQTHTVSGIVTDRQSGETLIGVTVLDRKSGKGVLSNSYGFYSLTLRGADTVSLRVSYVGYTPFEVDTVFTSDVELNIALRAGVELKEVTVSADKVGSLRSSQISAIDVPLEHIKSVPVIFGETDVLKALQLMPGVQSGTEGTSGLYVRGGGPDENLFLLDGVPLYNVNHMAGFFSAFNADAVKNVTLYKGSFPAHFSGRLSSVVDVTTNNGNDKEYHGSVSAGLIAAKLAVEGPIVKERTTFSLSGRRTYADLLIQPLMGLLSATTEFSTTAGYYFYDANAKLTHKFSDRSRLYASFYMGDDVIYTKFKTKEGFFYGSMGGKEYMKLRYGWGNIASSVRWNYVINPRMFVNTTVSYTQYRNKISLTEHSEYTDGIDISINEGEMTYKSGIRDITARVDFDYAPSANHSVKFGSVFTHHIFRPEVSGAKINSYENNDGEVSTYNIDTTIGQSIIHAEELNIYAEDDWSITDAVKINAGINLSGFLVQQKPYASVQPRLSGRFLVTPDLSIKVGYAWMTQYMHLLSNSSISLPTDLWVPVTARIAPMQAHQVAVGAMYSWSGIADFSVEAYYKNMKNLMEYRDGASFWGSSVEWEDKVCLGKGWSYGIEFLVQRNIGKFTGWIGYTWSHSDRLFDRAGQEINNGKRFPAKYDRRHDVSVVLMYKLNKRIDFSLTWVYSTGNMATLALQDFEGTDGTAVSYVASRNNYRMPSYHRMDASVNFHRQLKHGKRTINVSVYNLYNHKNPFLVYEKTGFVSTNSTTGEVYTSSLTQLSIFPIIPSFSYTFMF